MLLLTIINQKNPVTEATGKEKQEFKSTQTQSLPILPEHQHHQSRAFLPRRNKYENHEVRTPG